MDAIWIITVFVMSDSVMEHLGHRSQRLVGGPAAEVLTVAVVAATYFQHHHERAVAVLTPAGYLSGHLSTSRCNRRLHALAAWLGFISETLGAVFRQGAGCVLDRMPVPVCTRARPARPQGARPHLLRLLRRQARAMLWLAAASDLHPGGPVNFAILPGSWHDLTPVHAWTYGLPAGARVFGDKACNSAEDAAPLLAETGGRLVPIRTANRQPPAWFLDELELRE